MQVDYDFARRIPTTLTTLLILALVTVFLAELSRYSTGVDQRISAVWPPSGIMLGAMLALGPVVLVVLAPVMLLWLLIMDQATLASAFISIAGQVAVVGVGFVLIRRVRGLGSARPLASCAAIYTRGAMVGGAVAATLGTMGLFVASSGVTENAFYDVFLVYWFLEAFSVVLFALPTYFCLLDPRGFITDVLRDLQRPKMTTWLLAIAAVLAATLFVSPAIDAAYSRGLGFAIFVLMMGAVLNARLASATVIIPLFSAFFIVFSLYGLAGLPGLGSMEAMMRSLLLLGGLVVLSQLMTAVNAERNLTLEQFRREANTDYLTGLANDRAIVNVMRSAIQQPPSRAAGKSQQAWFVHLEVLDFNQIEDLMGFRASRTLEALLARRLMATVGGSAHPARFSDGVYGAIVVSDNGEELQGELTRIYEAFNDRSFSAGHYHTLVRVTLGAVPLDGQISDHWQYLSAAAQAALMAQEQLPRIQIIHDVKGLIADRRTMTQRLELLKDAIANNRLALFAQPICPIGREDEKITYEILLRIEGEDGELISPGVFLPVAEAFGFMNEIDRWVIRKTLDTLAANPDWQARTRKCSVNLAGTSLGSLELVDYIRAEFERTGVTPGKIGFEITETQSIVSRPVAERITSELRALGCSVAVDDFGTGLATFDYLKSFDFDVLKIDGAFIRDLASNPHDQTIVQAMCDVARSMGLKTVAEFVENDAVVTLLKDLGVDYGQGFGLGRPMAMAALFAAPTECACPRAE